MPPPALPPQQQLAIDATLSLVLSKTQGIFTNDVALATRLTTIPDEHREALIQSCIASGLLSTGPGDGILMLTVRGLVACSDPRPKRVLEALMRALASDYDRLVQDYHERISWKRLVQFGAESGDRDVLHLVLHFTNIASNCTSPDREGDYHYSLQLTPRDLANLRPHLGDVHSFVARNEEWKRGTQAQVATTTKPATAQAPDGPSSQQPASVMPGEGKSAASTAVTAAISRGGHPRLRILHISDLHARSKDGPQGARARQEAARRDRVLGAAWDRNIDEVTADAPPDIIVFTGDLADWGHPTDYDDGVAFLKRTCIRALRLAPDSRDWSKRLYIIPGNHDVDRNSAKSEWALVRALAASDPVSLSRWLAGEHPPLTVQLYTQTFNLTRPAQHAASDEFLDRYFTRTACFWTTVAERLERPDITPSKALGGRLGYRHTLELDGLPRIHIIGLDSSWLCGGDDDAGRIMLTEDQLLRLTHDDNGQELDGFRLALMHHPITELSTLDPAYRELRDRVDLLLRGHQHTSASTTIVTPGHHLHELAAGCLFEGHEKNRHKNGMQIIDIEFADRPRVSVHFRCWSPDEHFWHNDASRYHAAPDGRYSFSLPRPVSPLRHPATPTPPPTTLPSAPPSRRPSELPTPVPAPARPADGEKDFLSVTIDTVNRGIITARTDATLRNLLLELDLAIERSPTAAAPKVLEARIVRERILAAIAGTRAGFATESPWLSTIRRRQDLARILLLGSLAVAMLAIALVAVPSRRTSGSNGDAGVQSPPLDANVQPTEQDAAPQDASVQDAALQDAPTLDAALDARGECNLREFRSNITIDSDTTLTCEKVVFFDGVTVRVTGGHRLVIDAARIEVRGHATIDGRGVDGQVGPKGQSIQGEWRSQGSDDYNSALNDCRTNPNHFDRGHPGEKGSPGGAGATVILKVRPRGELDVLVDGGRGGPGGPGGSGRLLIRGDNATCNGCTMNCPQGPDGPQGDPGPAGRKVIP